MRNTEHIGAHAPCSSTNDTLAFVLRLNHVELRVDERRDVADERKDFRDTIIQDCEGGQDVDGRMRDGWRFLLRDAHQHSET